MCVCVCVCVCTGGERVRTASFLFGLVLFYSISTIVGYLMSNSF